MLTETFGIITPDKILGNKENRPKIIGHDKSEHIISENSMVFRKKLKSLERRWKKVSIRTDIISKYSVGCPCYISQVTSQVPCSCVCR